MCTSISLPFFKQLVQEQNENNSRKNNRSLVFLLCLINTLFRGVGSSTGMLITISKSFLRNLVAILYSKIVHWSSYFDMPCLTLSSVDTQTLVNFWGKYVKAFLFDKHFYFYIKSFMCGWVTLPRQKAPSIQKSCSSP